MKIAVSTNSNNLDGTISESFEAAKYLLIVESDNNTFKAYEYAESEDADGISKAKDLVKEDCEVVITGTLSAPAFEVISFAQVTRYEGAGLGILEAIKKMDAYQLEYIRVPEGEVWTPHDHSQETCECGVD